MLGWNAKLWFEGRQRDREFDVPIRTNGQHMRAPADMATRSERHRIAVVGDSFVWGHGVREEERFTDRMQLALGSAAEVLNFGIGGFGTDQYLLKIREEVLDFSPDLLLVAFFINDLYELNTEKSQLGPPKPRFVLAGAGLELRGVPVPRAAGWDRRRDPLRLELVERIRGFLRRPPQPPPSDAPLAEHFYAPNPQIEHLRRDRKRRLRKLLRLNDRLLGAIRAEASGAGMPLVVVEVPFKEFFIPDETLGALFGLDRARVDFGLTQRELTRLAGKHDFLYLNPYGAFAASAPVELYFRRDQHLNARGHAVLADRIVDGLRAAGLDGRP